MPARNLVALLLAAGAAVALLPGAAPSPAAGAATPDAGTPDAAVTKAETIAGQPVVAASDGPWKVRRNQSAAGAPGMARDEESAPVMKGGGGVGGRGLGALATTGAGSSAGDYPATLAVAASPPTSTPRPSVAPPSKMAPRGAPGAPAAEAPRQSGGLKAGATDDNEDFAAFLKFLGTWTDRKGMANQYDPLDVHGRDWVRVLDAKGNPFPAAEVRVTDVAKDKRVWTATTYGDGRVPFFPRVAAQRGEFGKLVVEVAAGGARKRMDWDGKTDLTLTLDAKPPAALKLDVLFLIDTTGSMGDEIDRVKATLLKVTEQLRKLKMEFDLRYGAVLYRDVGDEYLTRVHPFTKDIAAFDKALQSVGAGGGGDEAESVNQALAEAMKMDWRPDCAKVAFLIADAPPHMDYQGDVPYGESLVKAVEKGIRIHSVAASGLNEVGTLVFRQVAEFTRGKFIFIEYGSAEETAARHGVTGSYKSNNLDDIIFEQIRDELAFWGKDRPLPQATK